MVDDQRRPSDDDRDRELVLAYVRQHPNVAFEEAAIKQATQVNKAIIRRLLRDVSGIDQSVLEKGKVCWIGNKSETAV